MLGLARPGDGLELNEGQLDGEPACQADVQFVRQ